jgi:hypothetical protein
MDRIRTAAVVGVGVAVWLVAALVPASANDSKPLVNAGELTLAGGGPTWWDFDNGDSACVASDGFTPVDDGAFGPDQTQSDAFDGGLIVNVNGKDLRDRDGIYVTKGDDVIVDGINVQRVHVWRVERALSTSPTLRSLIAFRNTSRTSKDLTVQWDSNLGSDGTEAVRASSSGDTSYQPRRDRWVVSSDDATTPSDPPLTFALFGKKAAVKTDSVVSGCTFGDGEFTPQFKITVPGRATRYLLFFTEMRDTNAHATNTASRFDDPSRKLLVGLSATVKSQILNWKLT